MVRTKGFFFWLFREELTLSSSFQILITSNTPIDTTGKEPDERFDTALRALEVIYQTGFLLKRLI